MILLLLHSKKLKKEKIMRKIVILLGIILFMIACEKGNEEVREAKVVVVVYDENGKIFIKELTMYTGGDIIESDM